VSGEILIPDWTLFPLSWRHNNKTKGKMVALFVGKMEWFNLNQLSYPRDLVPLYTTDKDEMGTTVKNAQANNSYVCEGIVGYLFCDQQPNTVPLYCRSET